MYRTIRIALGLGAISLAPLIVPACGSDSTGGDGPGAGGSTSSTGGGPAIDPGTSVGGGTARACEGVDDCESEEVCHPAAQVCVTPGSSCTSSEGCPEGSYCDPGSEVCLPGLAGSPCASDVECEGSATCSASVCACSGVHLEQETVGGPLDVYFIFDRTGSMGNDCEYEPGSEPPDDSKACYATYAMSEYLVNVSPQVDTRLAFQFMSYSGGCDGGPYSEPLDPGLSQLPFDAAHPVLTAIDEEDFGGGQGGTQIEGALIGITNFTANNLTPGREMIGVLMTDGDPNGCNEDIDDLAQIIADHLEETGIRTFIIGMEGATDENLEQLAIAGGAEPHDDFCGSVEPPCHYWNVGDGSGSAISDALDAIAEQAAPFPCEYDVAELRAPDGSQLDLSTVNIQLSQGGEATIIGNVAGLASCPEDQPAWYYDDDVAPSSLSLCPNACDLVASAEQGARMNIVAGCSETMVLR